MFDAYHVIVAYGVQSADKLVPPHLAQAGQAWDLPAHTQRQDASLVELLAIDAHVLRVHVEDAGAEVVHNAHVVDHLPDEVRWIEIEAEVRVRDNLPHPPPDGGGRCQVVSTRPLVVGEDHRAVLDGDLYAMIGGKLHERRPDLFKLTAVLLNRLVPVTPDEGPNDGHVQHLGGDDDFLQVISHHRPVVRIGVKGIGVVSERRDFQSVLVHQAED